MIHRPTFSLVTVIFLLSAAAASAQTPGPPTNVTVVVNANRTMSIQWSPPTTGGAATGYIVQIGTSPGANDRLSDQIGNVTSYTTSIDFDPGATYYVRVRALNASGVSGPSNEVTVTINCSTPAESPIAVTWRMLTATSVQITWVGPLVSPFTNYRVEVGSASGLSDVAVATSGSGRRTFVTITLPGAGTFFARVRGTGGCSGVDGPASSEIQIGAGGATSPSTTIVVNEFSGFVELKNISTSAVSVGGWRIQTTTGSDQLGVLAGSIRGGTMIAPGCTYLMVDPRDTTVAIPADEPLAAPVNEGVAVVRSDGLIVDSAGRVNSFDLANPNTPFIEGTGLPARRDSTAASFARAGDVDTNNNSNDFVALTTATPQNTSGCGQSAPAAPTNLTASTSATSVTLSWNAPTTGGAPAGYFVRIGTTSGASDVVNRQIGAVTTFQTVLSPGTYFARVLAFNGAGVSGASNEVTVVVSGGPATPGAPTNLTATVSGSTVTLSWSAPTTGGAATQYRLEAGTSPGSSDAGLFDLGASPLSVSFAGVPTGTYYARLRAVNAVGVSGPSNEVIIVVCPVGCPAPPGPVTQLTAQVSDRNVLLAWQAPTTGATPTGYVIEAGSGSGLTNIGQFPTGSTSAFVIVSSVPPGTYFVRVRATAGGVLGPVSNEVVVVVQ